VNLLVFFSVFLLLPILIALVVFTIYQANIIKKLTLKTDNNYMELERILKEMAEKIENQQKVVYGLHIRSDRLEKRLNNKESIDLITKKTAQSIEEVINLYKQGYDIKTIASKLHRGDQEIELILKRFDENRANL